MQDVAHGRLCLRAARHLPLLSLISLLAACPSNLWGSDDTEGTENIAQSAFVNSLLGEMTLEEKVGQLVIAPADAEKAWLQKHHVGTILDAGSKTKNLAKELREKHRKKIPVFVMANTMNGHAFYPGATIFPSPLALSQSWNPELVQEIGVVTAKEMRATGAQIAMGVSLGVARDLRWEHTSETFGEDPWLVAKLSAARIEGLQQPIKPSPFPGAIAAGTHFLGASQTMGGNDGAENALSERALRQSFLLPYEAAIRKKLSALVVHNHSILSKPLGIQPYWLQKVLRDELGFDGLVFAAPQTLPALVEKHFVAKDPQEATQHTLAAGNTMFLDAEEFLSAAVQAVKDNRISPALINDACKRVLETKIRLGLFSKKERKAARAEKVLAQKSHHDLATEAASQSVVLLKNQGMLPLSAQKLERKGDRIVVTGPFANNIVAQAGDNSFGPMKQGAAWMNERAQRSKGHRTVLQGIKRLLNGKVRVDYSPMPEGSVESGSAPWSTLVIAVVGSKRLMQGESQKHANLTLDPKQLRWLRYIKSRNNTLIVVVMGSKPFAMPWLAKNAEALVFAPQPGMKGGDVVADMLFGQRSPEGRLTLTLPRDPSQALIHYDRPLAHPQVKQAQAKQAEEEEGQEAEPDSETSEAQDAAETAPDPSSPLYAFGEGLSYTKFCYEKIHLDRKKISPEETLRIDVTVKNCGARDGTEVVQVYLRDLVASTIRPHRKLVAFKKVKISKDQSKRIQLQLPKEALETLDDDYKRVVEPGEFEVMVGPSSRLEALTLRDTFKVSN